VVINVCYPATCWDTTYVGLHVATIRPGTGTAPSAVSAVPVGPSAAGVAVDRTSGRRFVRYPDRVEELLADGSTVVAWSIPQSPGQVGHRITGLAAANGRLVVSTAYTDIPPPPAQSTAVSQLRRIDGGDQVLGVRLGAEGSFGAVTLDPTGRRLAFEGRTGASRQLFLLELP
jgi:hypothetical protein